MTTGVGAYESCIASLGWWKPLEAGSHKGAETTQQAGNGSSDGQSLIAGQPERGEDDQRRAQQKG